MTCDLPPPPTCACFSTFEQFIGQQMVQLQIFILDNLHHHTFSNMFFKEIFEAYCDGPKGGRLVYNLTNFPSCSIIFPSSFHITFNTI
jgi:hypothetical protein